MLKSKNRKRIDEMYNRLTVLVMFIPLLYPLTLLLRIKNGMLPLLDYSYRSLNLIESYSHMSFTEVLEYSRISSFRPFEYMLSILGPQDQTALIVLCLSFLTVLNVTLLWLLRKSLSRFKAPSGLQFFTLLFFAISPIFFLNSFQLINPLISAVLILMAFNIRSRRYAILKALASIFFWPLMIIPLLTYLYYKLKENHIPKKEFKVRSITYIMFFLVNYMLFTFPKLIPYTFFQNNISISLIISDFGNISGFSLPIFILSIAGFAIDWFKNRKFFLIYLSFFLVLLLSFYIETLMIVLSFLIAYWSATFLILLYKRRWDLVNLKSITFFVLICFILFSSLSLINNISHSGPSEKEKEAMEWMHQNEKEGTVLSSARNSILLKQFTNSTPYIDSSRTYDLSVLSRIEHSQTVYHSRNLIEVEQVFIDEDIRYVYIDEDMKNGEIWTNKEQGLLFLLRNSEIFKNIFNSDNIEIWEYTGSQTG